GQLRNSSQSARTMPCLVSGREPVGWLPHTQARSGLDVPLPTSTIVVDGNVGCSIYVTQRTARVSRAGDYAAAPAHNCHTTPGMKRSPQPAHWLTGARKWITVSVTTAAAVIGLLANARNLGLTSWLGACSLSYADIAARRVLLHPTADTLHAIGDTLQLAATVTDERGATIAGATIIWRTEDSSVVTVDSSGTALARGPGTATVTAAVREHVGRSRVTVWQRATSVMVGNDSVLKLAEGSTMQLA